MNCTVLPIQVVVRKYVRYRCNIVRRKIDTTLSCRKLDNRLILIKSKNRVDSSLVCTL